MRTANTDDLYYSLCTFSWFVNNTCAFQNILEKLLFLLFFTLNFRRKTSVHDASKIFVSKTIILNPTNRKGIEFFPQTLIF